MNPNKALPHLKLRYGRFVCVTFAAISSAFCGISRAQTSVAIVNAALPDVPVPTASGPVSSSASGDPTVANVPCNFLRDQAAIWSSPVRIRPHDLQWLVPLSVAVGAAIATDHRAMTQMVSHDPGLNNTSINTSNALLGGLIATPVALFAAGHLQQNEHAREAGVLGGEALLDGLVVEQGTKLIFWRERPDVDSSRGRFFQSAAGADSSFPSSHSTLAWSAASAIATEYSSPWVQVAAYTSATGVSITRVIGRDHFPSDVLVGAAAGWLVGHYVVKHHRHPLKTHLAQTAR
jgi:membrane-associated phospholipid phosphatase